jgi:hypothetical protein
MVLRTDFGSRVDPDVCATRGFAYADLAKTLLFVQFLPFFYDITHGFWSRGDPDVLGTPGFAYVDLAKTHRFGPF